MSDPKYKVILAGERKVGKTRLFKALTEPFTDYGMECEQMGAPNIQVLHRGKEMALLKMECNGEVVQVKSACKCCCIVSLWLCSSRVVCGVHSLVKSHASTSDRVSREVWNVSFHDHKWEHTSPPNPRP